MKHFHTKYLGLCNAKISTGVSVLSQTTHTTTKNPLSHLLWTLSIVLLQWIHPGQAVGQTRNQAISDREELLITSSIGDDLPGQDFSPGEPSGQPTRSMKSGLELNPIGEQVKITREDNRDKGKIVTTIRVIREGVSVEYHRVAHDWGGVYYFRNRTTSIPETLFMQWTGMRY